MPRRKAPASQEFEFLNQVIYDGTVWEVLWQQRGKVRIRSTAGGQMCLVDAGCLRQMILGDRVPWEDGTQGR